LRTAAAAPRRTLFVRWPHVLILSLRAALPGLLLLSLALLLLPLPSALPFVGLLLVPLLALRLLFAGARTALA
jgi:hypothetical protein